jgi:FAD/FMN-containing dehydrogenase
VVAGEPTSDETADEAVEDDESEDDLDEFTRLRDRLDPDD